MTFPTRGIFGGQGSIVNLISGEKANEMVLVPAAGQYIALGGGAAEEAAVAVDSPAH